MGLKTHRANLEPLQILRRADKPARVGEGEKSAGVTEAKNFHAGLLLDIGCELLAERSIEHLVGHADVRESERHIENADHRISRRKATDGMNAGLDHARPHLLQHLCVLAKLPVWKRLNLNRAIRAGFHQAFKNLSHGAGRIVERVVVVQVVKLDNLLCLGLAGRSQGNP